MLRNKIGFYYEKISRGLANVNTKFCPEPVEKVPINNKLIKYIAESKDILTRNKFTEIQKVFISYYYRKRNSGNLMNSPSLTKLQLNLKIRLDLKEIILDFNLPFMQSDKTKVCYY